MVARASVRPSLGSLRRLHGHDPNGPRHHGWLTGGHRGHEWASRTTTEVQRAPFAPCLVSSRLLDLEPLLHLLGRELLLFFDLLLDALLHRHLLAILLALNLRHRTEL